MRWPAGSGRYGCGRTRIARRAGRRRRSRTCRCTATSRRLPGRHRPVPSEPLGILLLSGAHDRAHYAFVLATGAASIGRRVVIFATNAGCHALLADWSGLTDAPRDARISAAGVAGLDELRDAATALGIELIACEAG